MVGWVLGWVGGRPAGGGGGKEGVFALERKRGSKEEEQEGTRCVENVSCVLSPFCGLASPAPATRLPDLAYILSGTFGVAIRLCIFCEAFRAVEAPRKHVNARFNARFARAFVGIDGRFVN